MPFRIKFFRDGTEAHDVQRFLNAHGIKNYLRERSASTIRPGEPAYGFDVFILHDDDEKDARQLLDFEYGAGWGDIVSENE